MRTRQHQLCGHCGAPIDWQYKRSAMIHPDCVFTSWDSPNNLCDYCGSELPRHTPSGYLTPYGKWIEQERAKYIGVLDAIPNAFNKRGC